MKYGVYIDRNAVKTFDSIEEARALFEKLKVQKRGSGFQSVSIVLIGEDHFPFKKIDFSSLLLTRKEIKEREKWRR